MPIRSTSMRSPGPGPITLAMWRPLTRSCFVKGQPVVLHTDSARAYSLDVPDITHTSIVHQLKRINGVWVQPVFTKVKEITLSNGDVIQVKAGTQTIDGFWSHLRSNLSGGIKGDNDSMDGMIRMAQFQYWNMGQDAFRALAKTM
eukprot:5177525-Amphidinium_carterae.1